MVTEFFLTEPPWSVRELLTRINSDSTHFLCPSVCFPHYPSFLVAS